MKKTLLVSAVAMAISGNAMAADIYGNIRLGLTNFTPPDAGPPVTAGVDELDVRSGKLVLGAKGSEDLGNGMVLSYGLELEHDKADSKNTGWANDKSWVAIGGDFGTVTAGRKGDLAGWVCGGTDILTHGTAEACSLGHNTEFDNAIMYTGGAGPIEFGVVFTADGTDADQDTSFGVNFNGGDFSVGAVVFQDESANGGSGASQTQIGGTYKMGDITLGITIGDNDNDASDDTGGVDLGLSMPMGGGNLAVVLSQLDADTGTEGPVSDGSSIDFDWSNGLGRSGYWGIEYNSKDNWEEDRVIGYIGTNF